MVQTVRTVEHELLDKINMSPVQQPWRPLAQDADQELQIITYADSDCHHGAVESDFEGVARDVSLSFTIVDDGGKTNNRHYCLIQSEGTAAGLAAWIIA